MAAKQLKSIFLSASIPFKERDPKYFESADVIAIRDAVVSLATSVLPRYRLVWGGHPSITPIIYYVMLRLGLNIQEHVTLYQSKFFEKYFPEDNNKFHNVILTDNTNERESSLLLMRTRMFSENELSAGIFIGGMEGVEEEFKLFREYHPNAILLPIASTGGAAKIVFNDLLPEEIKSVRLDGDYAYMSVFQDFLIDKI
jgi:SLOG-like protein